MEHHPKAPSPSVWTSRADCERLLQARSIDREPRVGTWNVQYFPDAQEEPQKDEEKATDVSWLACAIASLDVDILAVQEFKQTSAARDKQSELIRDLNERTAGDWRIELSQCKPDDVQHPGFLYDATRVMGSHFRDVPALSPDAECSNNVSPGFAGYFSFPRGPDFHLVAVQMQAYRTQGDHLSRAQSVAAMGQVVTEARAVVNDDDIVFVGDFNTTGCDECSPSISSSDEVLELNREVTELRDPMSLVPSSLSCSNAGGELLDHFVAIDGMQGLPAGALARVSGVCAETDCSGVTDGYDNTIARLSDHCPVILQLSSTDRD